MYNNDVIFITVVMLIMRLKSSIAVKVVLNSPITLRFLGWEQRDFSIWPDTTGLESSGSRSSVMGRAPQIAGCRGIRQFGSRNSSWLCNLLWMVLCVGL